MTLLIYTSLLTHFNTFLDHSNVLWQLSNQLEAQRSVNEKCYGLYVQNTMITRLKNIVGTFFLLHIWCLDMHSNKGGKTGTKNSNQNPAQVHREVWKRTSTWLQVGCVDRDGGRGRRGKECTLDRRCTGTEWRVSLCEKSNSELLLWSKACT